MSHPRRTPAGTPRAQSIGFEKRTRSECGFDDVESSLAPFGVSASQTHQRNLTKILSYLGSRNPFPAQIGKDDIVWLLDNVAFRAQNGNWHAEFVAAAFDHQASPKLVDLVGDIASRVGLSKGDKEEATIEKRIAPFVMEVLPGRQVNLKFDNATDIRLGPGGRNGISSDVRKVTDGQEGAVTVSKAVVPQGVTGMLEMKTVYAEPEGWAVISDVDDTIKVTQTSSPVGILRSTFVSQPTPIQGMPELYAYIQTMVTSSAPWFYLSASPYNLYPFLRKFRDDYFPHGQLILRDSNLMTISGLLSNLTLGTEKYKVDRIEKIHRWLPRRKMILIGDSTQSDPEAYGDACRMFPGWIKLILIRKVEDIAAVGIHEKNEPQRFEKAFEDLPRELWHVFEDPAECQELIHKTVTAGL
ncbi:uncharacterized protein QC763_200030 [Podospora pseudopauciseta]|uniref:Phosphatidate phosphatase APP1 catalytic domain-containing protein n=2 Tax=Podospora TaxID=5144 RepID=A0ABR0HML1_9PEZI|nr:hypothetical protein QC763_200030 [Podospora pseudopauciseta]KAK4678964.1 hypothetical protein QC764_200030 [Podospora pseudoanserina]